VRDTLLNIDRTSVKRVLIYRLGSLGDTVVAMPCFHLIARAFPHAERLLLTNFPVHAKAPASAAVLGESSLVHGFIHYTTGMRQIGKLLRLAWTIRRFRVDLLVYLNPPRGERAVKRDAMFFRLCGIKHFVGLPLGELAENRYNPSDGLWESEASRLLRCVRPLGDVDVADLRNWDLQLTDAEFERARELLAPFGNRSIIACGPGTKQQSKEWGQEKWRELLERLFIEFPGHALILIGSKEEISLTEFVAVGWKGLVLNLCGALTARESAAVIRRAQLFLGPDSGPMHLAAAYGVPCAIPFASIDYPGRQFPIGTIHRPIYHPVECARCRLVECIEKKKICINSITVEEMFRAALQAIGREETVVR
jgi:ADP-heptose:LPS heptosyltransferase